VKEFCEETNVFYPNSSSFNQNEETSLFGLLKLNQYSNMNSLKSQILKDKRQCFDLCQFSPNEK
jgi:hypothetical protein